MAHSIVRVLICVASIAFVVPMGCGAEPTGPRTLENLLENEKPEQPPAAGDPNNGKFDPATAEAINDAEAKACLNRYGKLSFSRLVKLGPFEARILAFHEYGVAFDALANIDQPTAEALAQCQSHLSLNGIAGLDDPVAAALARCKGRLELTGLTALTSPALAAKLASQGTVYLPEVPTLNESVIRAFCTAPCHLYLGSLVHLEVEAADALRNHRGVLDIDGLVNPPPDVLACILRNQGPIGLGATNSLGNPTPNAVLDALAQCQGSLCLNGLKQLQVNEAKAIRKRTHDTDLKGVNNLTADIAAALINCDSVIWLLGVEHLDPKVVQILLQHKPRPGTGFVFSATLYENLLPHERKAFEEHESLHGGNVWAP